MLAKIAQALAWLNSLGLNTSQVADLFGKFSALWSEPDVAAKARIVCEIAQSLAKFTGTQVDDILLAKAAAVTTTEEFEDLVRTVAHLIGGPPAFAGAELACSEPDEAAGLAAAANALIAPPPLN